MDVFDYPTGTLLRSSIERLTVSIDSSLLQAMTAMEMSSQYGLPAGLSIVLDEEHRLAGVITDGDVREALLKGLNINSPVTEVMTNDPVVIFENTPVEHVLNEIQRQIRESGRIRAIRHAILVDKSRHVLGLVDVDKFVLLRSSHWDVIGVIGLGHVGLTVAVVLAERGFTVIGFDKNDSIIDTLRKGVLHIYERNLDALLRVQLEKNRFLVTSSFEELKKSGAFLICVNTPVNGSQPDLTDLKEAISTLTGYLKPSDLVIVRSTVPVGTCRNVVKNIIESRTNYLVGRDIGLAYAPERVVAGAALEELHTLPQVIGAIDDWSAEATARIFSRLSSTIIKVDTLEEAEIIKLINNTFRDISFAFANEIAMTCATYNLDAVKIIKAANSGYPRNPISVPSPGVGGPCLTKDPYIFLTAKEGTDVPSVAEVGRRINEQVPKYIGRRLLDMLQQLGKKPAECTIFILGFAYKGEPETTDMRNSPTLDLVAVLRHKVGTIYGWDAIVSRVDIEKMGIMWKDVEEGFTGADAVLFMNNHRSFASLDVYRLAERMKRPAIFFDGWGLFDSDEIEQIPSMLYMGMSYLTPGGGRKCGTQAIRELP
ncbi:UDP-N-acetyl-D-mannosamine dehydrogenase [subsurface metagenome]